MKYDSEFDIHVKVFSYAREDDQLREQVAILQKSEWFAKQLPTAILKFFHGTTMDCSTELKNLSFKRNVKQEVLEKEREITRREEELNRLRGELYELTKEG